MDGPDTSARMPFGVLINRNGNHVLLGLSGEFSSEAGSRFEEAIEEISREPVADLIVDLSGITYMDSSGAFLLYELYKRFSGQANVMLEGGSGEIQRIFESAGLIGVLPIAFPGVRTRPTPRPPVPTTTGGAIPAIRTAPFRTSGFRVPAHGRAAAASA